MVTSRIINSIFYSDGMESANIGGLCAPYRAFSNRIQPVEAMRPERAQMSKCGGKTEIEEIKKARYRAMIILLYDEYLAKRI